MSNCEKGAKVQKVRKTWIGEVGSGPNSGADSQFAFCNVIIRSRERGKK